MEKWISLEQVMAHEEATPEMLQQAMDTCVKQVLNNMPAFEEHFPDANSEGNFYTPGGNPYRIDDWTSGFWTGEVWLAYEHATDPAIKEQLKNAGIKQVETYLERINKKEAVDHHDMGFLYIPSCVACYKLTGYERAKEAAIKAADQLMTRYQPAGEFIQAWGDMNSPDERRLIIDCLLNIPLLYWATEITGKPHYRDAAEKHITTALKYIVRDDNSTWHTIFINPDGTFSRGATCQGYKDASAWARGQSWGIYGTAIAYKNTGRSQYIDFFKRVSDYLLRHLPDDICPFWDLGFGNGDEAEQPRDSSTAAIVACGFLEMSKYLNNEDAAFYTSAAKKLMASLIKNYQVTDPKVSNGQLLHGVYAKSTPYNTCKNAGVDECVIWGDYYFMEALTRLLKPDWEIYW